MCLLVLKQDTIMLLAAAAGFSLMCQEFGRMFNNSFPAYIFFFFKWRLARAHYSTLFHSGSASWNDCDKVFPNELDVSLFPERFQHYAWIAA